MKTLLVFDFDHTIVDGNSDTWVVKCIPEKKLPDWLRETYDGTQWNEYMQKIFAYFGDQGIKESEMKNIMQSMPYTAGMVDLLKFICQKKDQVDCIIISDSNTCFINWILEVTNSNSVFNSILTNPANFEQNHLIIKSFHSHNCPNCPDNLCKKKALDDFIADQLKAGVQYQRIIYTGDGANDLCPIKGLKECDVAMVRKGYKLEKLIHELVDGDSGSVLPSIVIWLSGEEILSYLRKCLKT
ncbi:pyridoxal phosphate phosphatase PHOSPHO2 [Rhincodon typus]|uniref:pyridoxal phosphate phosphatase PHOSPHO2 n=1 Tax=Rhincodon typus TaxID=259920 RepID=UPI0009A3FD0D|nr:pyridoxal phosphate phosphatase PHOSPHO2 [Rhincodon typus]XP_048455078.1 pyridoxal phosphate phosphatase PHOSPHO2 [Rhincodon typus]